MNGTEQRAHRTVTETLSARLDNVETVVTGLAKAARDDINEERTQRLKLADKQRAYVDNEDRLLRQSIQVLQVRTVLLSQSTLWERLRWLVLGR